MTILADELTRAYDNAYALWDDPILFLACLVILVMGLYLGVSVVLLVTQTVRLLVLRRRAKAAAEARFHDQLDRLQRDFNVTKSDVQDRMFGNLDLSPLTHKQEGS